MLFTRAFCAALGNQELIVACVVGCGDAETVDPVLSLTLENEEA